MNKIAPLLVTFLLLNLFGKAQNPACTKSLGTGKILCNYLNADFTTTVYIADNNSIVRKELDLNGTTLGTFSMGSLIQDSILVRNNQVIKKLANGNIVYSKNIQPSVLNLVPNINSAAEMTDGSFVLGGYQKMISSVSSKDSLVLVATNANLDFQSQTNVVLNAGSTSVSNDSLLQIIPLSNNQFVAMYYYSTYQLVLSQDLYLARYQKTGSNLQQLKVSGIGQALSDQSIRTSVCGNNLLIHNKVETVSVKSSFSGENFILYNLENSIGIAQRTVGTGTLSYYGNFNQYSYLYRSALVDTGYQLTADYAGDTRYDLSQLKINFSNSSQIVYHSKIIPFVAYEHIVRTGDTTCLILGSTNGQNWVYNPDCKNVLNCASKGVAPWELWISKVELRTINNASEKFKDFSTLGYSDYTNISTSIPRQIPFPLTVTPGLSWAGNLSNVYCRVWIDYNGNNIFEDSEIVLQSTNTNPFTSNVVIPFDALNGLTADVRMRVAIKWGSYPGPCETFDKGEVEDYTVNISGIGTKFTNIKVQNWSVPQSATAGQTQNSTFDIVSNGTLPVSNVPVSIYLSTDNLWSSNDLLVGTITTPPIGIQTLSGLSLPFTIPTNTSSGNYFLILKADINDQIPTDNLIVKPFVVQANTGNYCASKGTAPWELWISKVELRTINNASEKFKDFSTLGYSDYTNISTSIPRQIPFPLTVTPGLSWAGSLSNAYCRVWIDYNGNNVFEDSEIVLQSTNTNPFTSNVVIPFDALNGLTANVRMRVAIKWGSYPGPCETFDRGEVEDYTINISGIGTKFTNIKVQNWSVPQIATAGQTQNSTFDIVNTGTLPVSNVPVSVYLSSDNLWSSNDLLVGTIITPPIGIQTLSGLSLPFTIPTNISSGNYFLILKADINDQILTDNLIVKPFVVQVNTGNYCASKGAKPWEQWIEHVSVATNFISTSFPATGKEGYGDFTNLTPATMYRGLGGLITLNPQSSWGRDPNNANMYWRVWIDFNNDNIFSANEMVISRQVVISSGVFFDNENGFSIPATTNLGKTRMRIAMKVGGYPDPCETFERGEVEDYSVNIVNAPASIQPLVTFGNLKAEILDASVRLDWLKYSDKIMGYEIEKSLDGNIFGFMEKITNSTSEPYYYVYDNQPNEGDNFYRLKIILKTGEVIYSNVQSVGYNKIADFTLFPNPSQDEVFIDLKAFENKSINLFISNPIGKIVFNETIESANRTPHRLDISTLNTGIYFIRIEMKSKRAIVRKLQVMK